MDTGLGIMVILACVYAWSVHRQNKHLLDELNKEAEVRRELQERLDRVISGTKEVLDEDIQ